MSNSEEKRQLSFQSEDDKRWLVHELKNIGTALQTGIELLQIDSRANRDPSRRIEYLSSCLKRLELLVDQIQ